MNYAIAANSGITKLHSALLAFGCGLGWLLSYLSKEWDLYGLEVLKFAAAKESKYAPIHAGPIENQF